MDRCGQAGRRTRLLGLGPAEKLQRGGLRGRRRGRGRGPAQSGPGPRQETRWFRGLPILPVLLVAIFCQGRPAAPLPRRPVPRAGPRAGRWSPPVRRPTGAAALVVIVVGPAPTAAAALLALLVVVLVGRYLWATKGGGAGSGGLLFRGYVAAGAERAVERPAAEGAPRGERVDGEAGAPQGALSLGAPPGAW